MIDYKLKSMVGASLLLSTALFSQNAEKPNILFIFTDDHAVKSITAYSDFFKNIGYKTPNIDRIANEGAIFKNNTVCNSLSGPSRAAIMTGKHSHKNGFEQNVGGDELNPNQSNFPTELKKAGYQTAIFGKWHLGEKLKPSELGFEEWEVMINQGNYYNPDFRTKKGVKRNKGYSTDIIADKTINFLENRDKSKPFLAMCQFKAPHRTWHPATRHLNLFEGVDAKVPENFWWNDEQYPEHLKSVNMRINGNLFPIFDLKFKPNQVPSSWTLNYKNYNLIRDNEYARMNKNDKKAFDNFYDKQNLAWKNLNPTAKEEALLKYQRYIKDYLKTVVSVDENVGRLLDYLDENNLTENTLVVYSSDQSFFLGEKGWYDKRFMYKESFEMPLVMRYPKLIKPKTVINEVTQNIDFAPTFLDVAKCPKNKDFQGESLLPLFNNKKLSRDGVYYRFYETADLDHNAPRHYGFFDGRYKIINFIDLKIYELYDTLNDKSESKNLYKNGTTELEKSMLNRLQKSKEYYEDFS